MGKRGGDPIVIFLLVSGHGITVNGDVHLIFNDGTPYNVEDFIRSCSVAKNIKIIAVL